MMQLYSGAYVMNIPSKRLWFDWGGSVWSIIYRRQTASRATREADLEECGKIWIKLEVEGNKYYVCFLFTCKLFTMIEIIWVT